MCPPGYRHNGIIAARELGHTMYGYTLAIPELRWELGRVSNFNQSIR